ncbi:hypothetical protein [Candidatus Methanoperedens nitratireducens]|uniref:hypothetical protein n=1 Tax=Candidatus Methanoperedens nitratireducens TaxID=1392998 RepID=UPI0011776127|nr:hypothetical protein [Candidatus Methanoperedens nitroreducens]
MNWKNVILLLLITSIAVEPIENIAVREEGRQFPCHPGETTMHCTIRALHEDIFGEKPVRPARWTV